MEANGNISQEQKEAIIAEIEREASPSESNCWWSEENLRKLCDLDEDDSRSIIRLKRNELIVMRDFHIIFSGTNTEVDYVKDDETSNSECSNCQLDGDCDHCSVPGNESQGALSHTEKSRS